MLADQFRSHGFDLKFLIRAITATRAYGLTSAVGRSEPAPPSLFAAMPVRRLSPGQLYESLAQATGFRDGLGQRHDVRRGESSREQFLELFANRDEKPTEGETSILQALALMNGPLMAGATSLETRRDAGGRRRGALPRHARADRDALPRRADPPAPARGAGTAGAVRRAAAARPATRARPWPTSSGRCSNSPEFRFNH